jgi:hypothetical protein
MVARMDTLLSGAWGEREDEGVDIGPPPDKVNVIDFKRGGRGIFFRRATIER